MKIKTFEPPKPYIRLEIFRGKNDSSTQSLLIEDANFEEVILYTKGLLFGIVKNNMEESMVDLNKNKTTIVYQEFAVVKTTAKNNKGQTTKLQKQRVKQITTIGIDPKIISKEIIEIINSMN